LRLLQLACIAEGGSYFVPAMKTWLLLILASWALQFPAAAVEKLRVSSFSTVLTEIAERVGGDRVLVTAHVKRGVDPHEFEPKPSDLKVVSEAQIILLSAKHLEGYVGKLQQSTGTRGKLLEVGNTFASLKIQDPDHEHPGHDHGKNEEDPHWWHSIGCMQKATRTVCDAFADASPADRAWFEMNAAGYQKELTALASWSKAQVARLPRDKRKLVTSHDAFQYLAKDFGFSIYAIEGVSSGEQPSSKKVARIIALVKAQGVKAIFPESIVNPKVLQEITRETGAKVGGELYADGLGEGPAATYSGMYRSNISTIVDALN
jgi:ABC-type Zn uptake system ZnuABC Zn-binding protein ZnuA